MENIIPILLIAGLIVGSIWSVKSRKSGGGSGGSGGGRSSDGRNDRQY